MLSTIKRGTSGAAVQPLRFLLGLIAGLDYDAATYDAVTTFQKGKGLIADGIVGTNTWTALASAAKTLRLGDNGGHVAALQCLMQGLSIDGIYGIKTKSAVLAYQATVGLAADGICGPKTWMALIVGVPASGKAKQPVDYKQAADPWGSKMYSSIGNKSQTYANSACGPSAAADIVATVKDSSVTPYTLGTIAVAKGYRTASNGTDWGFFKYIADKYGFSKFIQTTSFTTLKASLDQGAYAVASMGPGYWTSGGHFICIWKYDESYVYANDPASSIRKKQAYAAFQKQRKQFFIFFA